MPVRKWKDNMTENQISGVIFAGTSEGRELAEYAALHGVHVLVSVVSEYGEGLLPEGPFVQIHRGRLDRTAMEELLLRTKPKFVLDATHPYARVVTEQLKELCFAHSISYQRVLRDSQETFFSEDSVGSKIYSVETIEEAIDLLKEDQEPVLLTTGSKELEVFAAAEHLRGRLYARVLPDSKVMAGCEKLGIHGKHLIAMQGPFSAEMNLAILKQTGAKWLVTKEAGARGGFAEKIKAAELAQVSVIVIGRPEQEQGISFTQAKHLLNLYASEPKELCLIGMGMGSGKDLTMEAAERLKSCDVVFGAQRMLSDVGSWTRDTECVPIYMPEQILTWLTEHPDVRRAVVVYSGDTGFYSGSSLLTDAVSRKEEKDPGHWNVEVLPGISSVSSLCAHFQISWQDLYLASAHGRECDLSALFRHHDRVFLLLGGKENLQRVCERLAEEGMGDVTVKAGIRMGYPDCEWVMGTAEELKARAFPELVSAIFEKKRTENER